MGTSTSLDQNIPQPQPLDPRFVFSDPKNFTIKEKLSLSGREFDVINKETNQLVLRGVGKVFSLREVINIYSGYSDQPMFRLKTKLASLRPCYKIFDPNKDKVVASIYKKIITGVQSNYRICVGDIRAYTAKVSWLGTSFKIKNRKKEVVATVSRDLFQFKFANVYELTCQSGVDTLLCLMSIMVMDTIMDKKKK